MKGNVVNPNSIRQTVIGMLLNGDTTADITAVLKDRFPDSAAAAKANRHIAWYRGQLRKSGQLPAAAKTVAAD